ncbi:MAG: SdpI family protein [Proteobacteria bacterium]|nr:SdpI family protein [Pseudomonadota bacterium]
MKIMNNRTPIATSAILIGAMLAASAWAWSKIPAGARIPIHWDIHGQPNGFATSPTGLLVTPAIAAVIALVFAVIPVIEPRRLNLARSGKFYHAAWIGVVALLAFIHGLTLYSMVYGGIAKGNYVFGAACILFAVIGNYMGKTRSMFLGGVRTPWTLSSEYSWQRTNRLMGRLFVVSGMLGVVATLTLPLPLATETFICAIVAAVVVSLVMSYVFWRHDPERDAENRPQ